MLGGGETGPPGSPVRPKTTSFNGVRTISSMGSETYVRDGLVEDLADGVVANFDELVELLERWRRVDASFYPDDDAGADDAGATGILSQAPDQGALLSTPPSSGLRRDATAAELRAFFACTPGLEAVAAAWDDGFDGALLFAEAEGRGLGLDVVLREMGLPISARSRIVVCLRDALEAEQSPS